MFRFETIDISGVHRASIYPSYFWLTPGGKIISRVFLLTKFWYIAFQFFFSLVGVFVAKDGFSDCDLLPVIHDLVEASRQLDNYDKEKACKFIANLVANGGNKTQAARAAGYGEAKDKNGKKRSEEARNNVAGVRANELLRNHKILELYEKLREQKFISTVLKGLLTKEHIVYLNFKMYEMYKNDDKKSNLAMSALQEIAKLEGYYAPEKIIDDEAFKAKLEEIVVAKEIISEAFKKEKNDK